MAAFPALKTPNLMKKLLLSLCALCAISAAQADTYRFAKLGGANGALVSVDVTPTATPFVFGGLVGGGMQTFGFGAGVSIEGGAILIEPDWASVANTPTTLAGYGITDALTADMAESTYEPIIGAGTLALSKLATDPLARANHTGTQDASTIGSGTLATARLDVASQAQAEAGTATDKVMTPERTAQAIAALAGGGHSDVQVFTSDGTWTKPDGAVYVDFILVGGGTGGSSGARAANGFVANGGAGGAPGKYVHIQGMAASLFGATEAVSVGVGGAGGAAVDTNDTNGNVGTTGTDSVFSVWKAKGGAPAGTYSAGVAAVAASCTFPFYTSFSTQIATGSSGASAGSTATPTALTVPFPTGGGGGGAVAGSGAPNNGGAGGGYSIGTLATNIYSGPSTAAGGAAGTAGFVGPATGGGDGGCAFLLCGTGGGGGGSNRTIANGGPGANGTNGGNGGLYGGGGGGGSGAENGFASGAGGKGGDGIVIIITHF